MREGPGRSPLRPPLASAKPPVACRKGAARTSDRGVMNARAACVLLPRECRRKAQPVIFRFPKTTVDRQSVKDPPIATTNRARRFWPRSEPGRPALARRQETVRTRGRRRARTAKRPPPLDAIRTWPQTGPRNRRRRTPYESGPRSFFLRGGRRLMADSLPRRGRREPRLAS